MRLIKPPGKVKVVMPTREGEREEEYTFARFVTDTLDVYPAKTPKQIRQTIKILDAVNKNSENVSLEDTDYDILKDAAEHIAFLPRAARQLLPFYDAIDQAEKV